MRFFSGWPPLFSEARHTALAPIGVGAPNLVGRHIVHFAALPANPVEPLRQRLQPSDRVVRAHDHSYRRNRHIETDDRFRSLVQLYSSRSDEQAKPVIEKCLGDPVRRPVLLRNALQKFESRSQFCLERCGRVAEYRQAAATGWPLGRKGRDHRLASRLECPPQRVDVAASIVGVG